MTSFIEIPGIHLPPQATPDDIALRETLVAQAKALVARMEELYPAIRDRLPLRRNIHRELLAKHSDVPQAVVLMALARVVYSSRYLSNMTIGCSRHQLDGSPKEKQTVSETDGRAAAQLLAGYSKPRDVEDDFFQGFHDAPKEATKAAPARPAKVQVRNPKPTLQKTEVFGQSSGRSPKVTVPIKDFEKLLALDSAGKSGVVVRLTLPCNSELDARLNPKSFRKAVDAFRACGGRASVMVTGELDLSRQELTSAGIAVFPQKS